VPSREFGKRESQIRWDRGCLIVRSVNRDKEQVARLPNPAPLHRWGWGLKSDGAGAADFDRTSAESSEILDALNCSSDSVLLAADARHHSFSRMLSAWHLLLILGRSASEIYRVLQPSNFQSRISAPISTLAGQHSTSETG
jgi:hypothetical protein